MFVAADDSLVNNSLVEYFTILLNPLDSWWLALYLDSFEENAFNFMSHTGMQANTAKAWVKEIKKDYIIYTLLPINSELLFFFHLSYCVKQSLIQVKQNIVSKCKIIPILWATFCFFSSE